MMPSSWTRSVSRDGSRWERSALDGCARPSPLGDPRRQDAGHHRRPGAHIAPCSGSHDPGHRVDGKQDGSVAAETLKLGAVSYAPKPLNLKYLDHLVATFATKPREPRA